MDPIANLAEQLEIAREIQSIWDACNDDGTLEPEQQEHVADIGNRLADLVLALDQWQRKGGFSPYVKR